MSQLQHVPLNSLELQFHWDGPLSRIIQALEALDMDALVLSFAHRISGLQDITISFWEQRVRKGRMIQRHGSQITHDEHLATVGTSTGL